MFETMTFAEWLAEGQKDCKGIVDIVNASGRGAFIKPFTFPEERIYFSTAHWTVQQRRNRIGDLRVLFDCPPQELPPQGKPVACNVRFKPREE